MSRINIALSVALSSVFLDFFQVINEIKPISQSINIIKLAPISLKAQLSPRHSGLIFRIFCTNTKIVDSTIKADATNNLLGVRLFFTMLL